MKNVVLNYQNPHLLVQHVHLELPKLLKLILHKNKSERTCASKNRITDFLFNNKGNQNKANCENDHFNHPPLFFHILSVIWSDCGWLICLNCILTFFPLVFTFWPYCSFLNANEWYCYCHYNINLYGIKAKLPGSYLFLLISTLRQQTRSSR